MWLRRPVCVWPGRKLPKTRFVLSWFILIRVGSDFTAVLVIGTYTLLLMVQVRKAVVVFSYLWCYSLWYNLVNKSNNSCLWRILAFGAVTLSRHVDV